MKQRPPHLWRALLSLSKKPVIASQSADWRGNPFSKHMILHFSIDLQLKDYGFPRRFAPRSKYPWGARRRMDNAHAFGRTFVGGDAHIAPHV